MADEKAPAEGAAVETPQTPAAEAKATAIDNVMSKYGIKDADQAAQLIEWAAYASTPAGLKEIVAGVSQKYGHDIAKQVLAGDAEKFYATLNSKDKRIMRRAIARQGEQHEAPETEGDTSEDAIDRAEEVRTSAKEALEIARRAEAKSDTAAKATALAPLLMAEARKDERIAGNFEDWLPEVTSLIESGHPRYPNTAAGVKAASDDVLNRWAKFGEKAGLQRPSAPSPKETANTIAVKPEDISKSVQAARERTRGQSSGALVDELMRSEFGA